jgi:hypothetical protein
LINLHEIDDDCDDKATKKHDDLLIDIDEIGSMSSIIFSNSTHLDKEELNMFIVL